MPDAKNHPHADNSLPENPRKAIREAREARLRVIDGPPKTIKVFAASEALRAVLRHSSGTRFRDRLDQGVEWPNDSFTKRRIADGSVRTEPASGEWVEPDPSKNPREQAAANKLTPPEETQSQDQAEHHQRRERVRPERADQPST
jgi:hypothetical protein